MLANEFWFIKIWMQKCKNLSAHWPFICTSYAHLIQNHKSNTIHDCQSTVDKESDREIILLRCNPVSFSRAHLDPPPEVWYETGGGQNE